VVVRPIPARRARLGAVLVIVGLLTASIAAPVSAAATFSVTGHLTDSVTDGPLACYIDTIDESTGQVLNQNQFSDFSSAGTGAYAIAGLDPARTYTLRTRDCNASSIDSYVSVAQTGVTGIAGQIVTLDFSLVRSDPVDLTVTVLDGNDVPIEACPIQIVDELGINLDAAHHTDAAGQTVFHLGPQPVRLWTDNCGGSALTWYDGAADLATATAIDFPTGSRSITWHPGGAGAATDTDAPSISCDTVPIGWQAADVTIHCTASDTESGLADAGEASFDLTTSVANGAVDGNASTDSRTVCDVDGNCADAGPYTGLLVDREAPTASVAGIVDGATILIGATPSISPSCGDGSGSGIASCTMTPLDTSTIGANAITVTAIDAVGHETQASIQVTVRYGTCGLNAKPSHGSTTITFKLCDAAGANLSSASLAVSAFSLTGPTGPLTLTAANGGVFTYVAKSKSYQLVVTTTGLPKGTYTLGVDIAADTVPYTLSFKLH
jgi:hypothetical protein